MIANQADRFAAGQIRIGVGPLTQRPRRGGSRLCTMGEGTRGEALKRMGEDIKTIGPQDQGGKAGKVGWVAWLRG